MCDSHRSVRILLVVYFAIVPFGLIASPSSVFAQTGHEQEHPSPPETLGPETTLRAFGSVEWTGKELRDAPNSFSLGQLSVFVTSTLTERVSVLTEVVLESKGLPGAEVSTDLERLQLTFRLNDFFNVSAGRFHTGIGFYNATFHHGSYFETVIGRPRVFKFEDDGGVLPIHELGVTARGVVPGTGSSLHYVGEVGNGRQWPRIDAGPSAGGVDVNDAKSTNVGLSYRRDEWRGVEVGASFYRDEISLTASSRVDHHVTAAYAVYRTPSTELLAEWLRLTHSTEDGSATRNYGGYAQASRTWGKLRPYYRFDRVAIDPSTPFVGAIGSYKAHIVGLRVNPASWVGLKGQYERADESGRRGVDGVRTQLVFVF